MRNFQLYAITGERFHPGRNMLEVMEEALIGGVDIVQLRDKTSSKKAILAKANQLRRLTSRYDALFIVNDHIDIALASDADGIHIGQDDLPLTEARKIVGDEKVIGVSTHSINEAIQAEKDGADYIGVGPVFPTDTKEDVVDPVTVAYVKETSEKIRIPSVAIGGIKLDNVDQVLEAGAKSICAVSEIVGSGDVVATCKAFREKISSV